MRRYAWILLAPLACGPGPGSETGAQSSTSAGDSTSTSDPPPTSTTASPTGTSSSSATTGETSPVDATTATTGPDSGTSSDSTGGASSTGSTGSSSSTGSEGGSSSEGSSSEGGEGVHCPQTEWSEGCPPVNCDDMKVPCGSLFSEYDAQGVRRKSCPGPTCECGPGFECFDASVWGGCVPSLQGCGFATDDCGGAYCVPDGLGPPFACGGTDEAACVGAGCTFVVAPWMDFGPDDCECGEALPLCLWFPDAGAEAAKPTAYYNPFTQQTRVFASEWEQPPFGWKPCAGDPEAPPACACAEQCGP